VAGRTDVGVHAIGQVAHLDLGPEQLSALARPARGHPHAITGAASLASRLNGIAGLDSDLRVNASSLAPDGFDARFSALWRRYEYRIADATSSHDPRRRTHTLWYPGSLDEQAMKDAAQTLLGLHDFASFCRPRVGATTIRTLQSFEWDRATDGVLRARLQADAFCHSMVRSLVGACVAVGESRLAAERIPGLRDEAKRGSEFKVMPAKGLTLTEVGYPPDDELAERAELTRARRDSVE
jgi:tRNA pseudouridine38-40 synthase